MAEETEPMEETQAQPETGGAEVDYRAKYEDMRRHAREWEKKAKANAEAADELEKLKQSQMSEAERMQRRYEEEKARADALQSEKDRAAWVREVSDETGVPSDLLALIAADSKEELAERAEGLRERYGNHAEGRAQTVPVVLGDGRHAEHAEPKGDFIREQFLNLHRH